VHRGGRPPGLEESMKHSRLEPVRTGAVYRGSRGQPVLTGAIPWPGFYLDSFLWWWWKEAY